MPEHAYPRTLGHIGVTVDDIDEAVEWYRDVLGFTPVMEPDTVTANDGHFGALAADAIGFDFGTMRIAHMATGNHIGLELFEFGTSEGEAAFDPEAPGLFHLCVQDPNVEELAERITDTGGEQLSEVWEIFPGHDEYLMTYCKDPFGIVVEIHSRGYEHMHSNMDY
ncbi:glyoxalase [Halobacteriales archaeon QS_8_65_32]|nr:MAG: glyoxalase [Halobacteriales archaeon QS_8_65_32]